MPQFVILIFVICASFYIYLGLAGEKTATNQLIKAVLAGLISVYFGFQAAIYTLPGHTEITVVVKIVNGLLSVLYISFTTIEVQRLLDYRENED